MKIKKLEPQSISEKTLGYKEYRKSIKPDLLKFELTQVYNLKKTLKLVKVSNNPKDKPKQIAEDFENDKGELVPESFYLTLSSKGINFEVNGIHLSTTVHIGPIGNTNDNIYHKHGLGR